MSVFPVFLAFGLNCAGIFVFKDSIEPNADAPFVSYLIFMFAVCLILSSMELYPASLRCLWHSGHLIVSYILSQFLLETAMANIWVPMECAVMKVPTQLADYIDENVESLAFFGEYLRDEGAPMIASYMISFFSLVCALHATRYIDIRMLKCGPQMFFLDIADRFQKWLFDVMCVLGMLQKRNVEFHDDSDQVESSEKIDPTPDYNNCDFDDQDEDSDDEECRFLRKKSCLRKSRCSSEI